MVIPYRLVAVDSTGVEHVVLCLSREEAIYPDHYWIQTVVQRFAHAEHLIIINWEIYFYGELTVGEARKATHDLKKRQ